MNKLSAYIRLVRPLNLLIILATQALFWVYIVEQVHVFFQLDTRLEHWQVFLLMSSTVLVAAGGYVINDYYDLPIDLVNKPDRVVISKEVSDNAAFNYYMILTALGVISALAVAWSLGKPSLTLLPVIIASGLWFYAQEFKRRPLVGNLVVGLSTAAVIFILLLFEVDWKANADALAPEVNEILKFGLAYMVFAFLTTMLREVVKDLEDMEGDAQFECRTFPIAFGVNAAKLLALFWLAVLVVPLVVLSVRLVRFGNLLGFGYTVLLLVLPTIYIGYTVVAASRASDYRSASKWIKGLMVAGVLTMIYIGIMLGKHSGLFSGILS